MLECWGEVLLDGSNLELSGWSPESMMCPKYLTLVCMNWHCACSHATLKTPTSATHLQVLKMLHPLSFLLLRCRPGRPPCHGILWRRFRWYAEKFPERWCYLPQRLPRLKCVAMKLELLHGDWRFWVEASLQHVAQLFKDFSWGLGSATRLLGTHRGIEDRVLFRGILYPIAAKNWTRHWAYKDHPSNVSSYSPYVPQDCRHLCCQM